MHDVPAQQPDHPLARFELLDTDGARQIVSIKDGYRLILLERMGIVGLGRTATATLCGSAGLVRSEHKKKGSRRCNGLGKKEFDVRSNSGSEGS